MSFPSSRSCRRASSRAPEIRICGRCRLRQNGELIRVDRAGHPSVSSFFNTDDTKLDYTASEPLNDRSRWLERFAPLMGHTGNYSREEAIRAIDKERTLPGMLNFDPSKAAKYANGGVFTVDVIDYRLAFPTRGECPSSRLKPHGARSRSFRIWARRIEKISGRASARLRTLSPRSSAGQPTRQSFTPQKRSRHRDGFACSNFVPICRLAFELTENWNATEGAGFSAPAEL